MVWGRVLSVLDSPVAREEAMWFSTPRCRTPGPARSTCACHLNGLPKPPALFKLIPLPNNFHLEYADVLLRRVVEERGYVDERDLQNWKGGVVCMTCQHFIYGVDQHCHTLLGCNLRQQQLQLDHIWI